MDGCTLKTKPSTLQLNEGWRGPTRGLQLTPSTPTVISSLQDVTPTNFKYSLLDTPDKDDVARAFSRHYKSIEDQYQRYESYKSYDNNNNYFTLDLLNCDDDMNGIGEIERPQQATSTCSSDVHSSSSSSGNKLSSSSYNDSSSGVPDVLKLTAKKRERNRLAAEKCRLKKQRKIKDLENEKRLRVQENNKLLEIVTKRTEKIRNLQIFYNKLINGEIKPQPCYN
uniref:1-Jun n=1 Tax=Dendrocoelum lacteum TaxID=27895 RepID=T1DFA5_9PLAT